MTTSLSFDSYVRGRRAVASVLTIIVVAIGLAADDESSPQSVPSKGGAPTPLAAPPSSKAPLASKAPKGPVEAGRKTVWYNTDLNYTQFRLSNGKYWKEFSDRKNGDAVKGWAVVETQPDYLELQQDNSNNFVRIHDDKIEWGNSKPDSLRKWTPGPHGKWITAEEAAAAFEVAKRELAIAANGEPTSMVAFGGHRIELVGELLGHADPINCVALSGDGKWALSGGEQRSVHYWNVAKLEQVRALAGHSEAVYCVAISDDGKTGLSAGGKMGGADDAVRVWDLLSGAERERLAGHEQTVRGVALLPDGGEAISVSHDFTMPLWSLKTASVVRHYEKWPDALPSTGRQVWSLALSHDAQRLIAGTRGNMAYLYDVASGQELQSLAGDGNSCFGSVAFSFDDQHALLASNSFAGADNGIYYFDLASGKCLQSGVFNRGEINSVVLLPDSKYALVASRSNTLVVWNIEKGLEAKLIRGHLAPVQSLAISKDGHTIISGSQDRTIRVWAYK